MRPGQNAGRLVGASIPSLVDARAAVLVVALPEGCNTVSVDGVSYMYCAGAYDSRVPTGWQVIVFN